MFAAGMTSVLQGSVAALRWTCCHPDTGKWVKFQAFSWRRSRVLSGLHLLQLILHLACFARALCQTHRLWKNNLTGFNLPPPPPPLPTPPPPPPLLPLAFFFRSFCAPFERNRTHFVWQLHATPGSFCKLHRGRFKASGVTIFSLVYLWCLIFCFFFLMFSVGVHFGLHSESEVFCAI